MNIALAYITVVALITVLVCNISELLYSLAGFSKQSDEVYLQFAFGITPRKTFGKFFGILAIRAVTEVILHIFYIYLISDFILKIYETLQTILKKIPTPLEFCEAMYMILICFVITTIGKEILDWYISITRNYITYENLMPQKI